MIKLLASGLNVEGKETPPPKVAFQRFTKRLAAVVLLFALPALLNRAFIWAGIYDEDGYCDLDSAEDSGDSYDSEDDTPTPEIPA